MAVEEVATAKKVKVATWSALEDRAPTYARVLDVDLVIVRYGDNVSVLYGPLSAPRPLSWRTGTSIKII